MSPNKYKDLPPKNNQKLYIWHLINSIIIMYYFPFSSKELKCVIEGKS